MAYPKIESVCLTELGIGDVPIDVPLESVIDWNFYGETNKGKQEMCDEYIDDVVKESVNITQNNKYNREIKKGVFVDVYDVLRAFSVSDPALQHLVKKALAVGQRGHKSTKEDYEDIVASAKRALEIYLEWE